MLILVVLLLIFIVGAYAYCALTEPCLTKEESAQLYERQFTLSEIPLAQPFPSCDCKIEGHLWT